MFNMRKGVVFSDGTPFDAEAALWNLNHWIGQPDHSGYRYLRTSRPRRRSMTQRLGST
ncbi:ABC transporter substrate-binding protein [Devosia sp. 66-22]|uniref:ABC transporter substrate-binding protein n=1 Tax=Devosia sp. 66-22 TaxID=1895753 RepID=UPI002604B8F4|nr:ABC transporter substrate-binding protein [Devosia sp. 66-22]